MRFAVIAIVCDSSDDVDEEDGEEYYDEEIYKFVQFTLIPR